MKMKTSKIIQAAHQLSKPYRITNGNKFRLKHVDPADTGDLKSADKPRAKEALQSGVEAMAELQDVLYAQDRWSLLLIFQAMDAARKDGTIKHVMSGVNPQGCQVFSFKQPSREELAHEPSGEEICSVAFDQTMPDSVVPRFSEMMRERVEANLRRTDNLDPRDPNY